MARTDSSALLKHPRRSHTDDCREPHRREGCDGESGGQSN